MRRDIREGHGRRKGLDVLRAPQDLWYMEHMHTDHID